MNTQRVSNVHSRKSCAPYARVRRLPSGLSLAWPGILMSAFGQASANVLKGWHTEAHVTS